MKFTKDFSIQRTIPNGCESREIVLIPKIPAIPSDIPFWFRRLLFSIKLCFAVTINKAQGQSLKLPEVG